MMETFSFDLYASGEFWDFPLPLAEAICKACPDSTPGTCEGVLEITFSREAESLEDAVLSAIRDAETADGIRISHVNIDDDPATASTINGLLTLRNSTTREHALEMWAKVG